LRAAAAQRFGAGPKTRVRSDSSLAVHALGAGTNCRYAFVTMADEKEDKLGRDVFLALAAVGWADGKLDQDEADAIVRTALEEGLELDEIAEIEEATKHPVTFADINIGKMSKADRLFVCAVASWMARLDGTLHPGEAETLGKLGEALRVPRRPREHAEAIAREIGEASESDQPSFFNLPKLRRTLKVRLAMAQQLRAAKRSERQEADSDAPDAPEPDAD
jgi:hypothetical protein